MGFGEEYFTYDFEQARVRLGSSGSICRPYMESSMAHILAGSDSTMEGGESP